MKKIFVVVALFATLFVQHGLAQESTKTQPSQLLTAYYGIKDALVGGNANKAAESAEEFVKTLNEVDKEIVKDENRNALIKDAGAISQTKSLAVQREKFANLSAGMYALAKSTRLSAQPVYLQYCPMKKSTWLSNAAAIKNPYFGSAMLTCGKVTETIQ